jgi:polyvinyl alcohol dehydrogenase (cytochrome)
MSVANGVVFAPSLSGDMVALDASNGKTLWKFASGGSVVDGPSIVDGVVYWGSGYGHFGIGTPNNKLFAFELAHKNQDTANADDNHGRGNRNGN